MKGHSVISPNAKPTPAREPRMDARPLTYDRAMQMALDRARAAQPPMTPLAGKAGMPWNSSHDQ